MTVIASSFRAVFTEFDSTKYPDATVTWWIARAYRMLRAEVWGDDIDDGVMLFIAHNLVLGYRNIKGAASDNLGASSGPVASKGVGAVSVSFDTTAGTIEGAADYNLTTYGVQFAHLMRMYGAGGIQVTGHNEDALFPDQEV